MNEWRKRAMITIYSYRVMVLYMYEECCWLHAIILNNIIPTYDGIRCRWMKFRNKNKKITERKNKNKILNNQKYKINYAKKRECYDLRKKWMKKKEKK